MAKLNPVFSGIETDGLIERSASVKGVALKTLLLLLIAVASPFLTIGFVVSNPAILIIMMIGAVVCGIIGQMSYKAAPVCSIIYAICEGTVLGLVSFAYEFEYSGIVLTAVVVTATIFGVMLLLYSTNIIRVTTKLVRAMSAVGISILVISLIYLISALISPNNILVATLVTNPGLLIFMSILLLAYGAFMLLLDFEQVNSLVHGGFDKRYEWTAALGLMVTLVWIYIEVLRLLAIIAAERD